MMKTSDNYWNSIVNSFSELPPQDNFKPKNKKKLASHITNGIDKSTINLKRLEKQFGERRLNRVLREMNIKTNRGSSVTLGKVDIHKIFLGLMNIKKVDIDELEGSVTERYRQLVFFKDFCEFEKSFVIAPPCIDSFQIDKVQSSGIELQGLAEKIYILAHHHFALVEKNNKKYNKYRDVEMLTSRLADREIQKDSVIHLHDGYFYADKVFTGGGAYVAVLRDLEEKKPPKIICRGTAGRAAATGSIASWVNDVLLEIGTMGVKSVWKDLSGYLKNNNFEEVEILGKSLGGAHAQELAILIEGILKIKIKRLTTYCSVGVGREINTLFKDKILKKRSTPFKICVIRNGGSRNEGEVDYVPAVGGVHLGTDTQENKCLAKVIYISNCKQSEVYPIQSGLWIRIIGFITSFKAPHLRQTTLKKYYWRKIEDKDGIAKHLKVGEQLEIFRQILAWIIHVFTLFLLNGRSFTSFYEVNLVYTKLTS